MSVLQGIGQFQPDSQNGVDIAGRKLEGAGWACGAVADVGASVVASCLKNHASADRSVGSPCPIDHVAQRRGTQQRHADGGEAGLVVLPH